MLIGVVVVFFAFIDRLKLCQCARFVRNFQRELGGNICNGTFCECYIAKNLPSSYQDGDFY